MYSDNNKLTNVDLQIKVIFCIFFYKPKYPLVEARPSKLCQAPENPSEIQGAAVAVQRGNCTLFTKAFIAKDAGAKEVIIASNDTLVSILACRGVSEWVNAYI